MARKEQQDHDDELEEEPENLVEEDADLDELDEGADFELGDEIEDDFEVDDEDEGEDEEDDGDGEDEEEAEEEEDEGDASLDQLLARRSAARRATEDAEDDDGLMSLTSAREPSLAAPGGDATVIPVKDRQEFVCSRCHLVKKRSQLADVERVLCRDCI